MKLLHGILALAASVVLGFAIVSLVFVVGVTALKIVELIWRLT